MKYNEFIKKINIGFDTHDVNGVQFMTVPFFDDKIVHCFTTRKKGVSTGGFSSLNFSFGREKNKENILKNFNIISNTLGIQANDIVLDNYGHTSNVLVVDQSHKGKGVYNNMDLPTCDGLATVTKGLPLVTMHADCAPIFFYDSEKMVVCVCHAGWRGVTLGIVKNAIDVMVSNFGCDKADILIGVGPCIQSCCFEIKHDLENTFLKEFGEFSCVYREGKIFGDLEQGILYSIYQQGIAPQNVTSAKECTYCNEDKYFSYRRQGQNGGAMASFMMIK